MDYLYQKLISIDCEENTYVQFLIPREGSYRKQGVPADSKSNLDEERKTYSVLAPFEACKYFKVTNNFSKFYNFRTEF